MKAESFLSLGTQACTLPTPVPGFAGRLAEPHGRIPAVALAFGRNCAEMKNSR